MLALSGAPRIFIYQGPTHMGKGFEGLCALVSQKFSEPVTSGAYFVFMNRTKTRMKVLYWDNDGLALWYKRLEQGTFPKDKNQQALIDRRDFLMLLEGVVPKRKHKRFQLN